MLRKLLGLVLLIFFAYPAIAQYRHVSMQNGTQVLPKKVLIIPADILVSELSAGGLLEKVPDWTKQSSENVTKAMTEVARSGGKFTVVEMPALTAEEKDQIEQAMGTFMVVGVTAHNMLLNGGDAWSHKRKDFDYTLGPGLAFLKKKTGADAAMVLVGDDVISSGGRKVTMFLATALGMVLSGGRSIVLSSVVDLDTGNLLWMHFDQSITKDLKDYVSATDMVTGIMNQYPDGK